MQSLTSAWKTANEQILAPEGLIELSCYIPELKQNLVYTKNDLMSFSHHQTGDLVSGELPKNHIEFTLDNSDGKWNPGSPTGLERYLSERLKITLRYGYIINGVETWIPGGVFYLTEWRTSYNGIEASFVARDILEYLLDKPYTGEISGTLYTMAQRAITEAALPEDISISVTSQLSKYPVTEIENKGEFSCAEILQKCANAGGCVMWSRRTGQFVVKAMDYTDSGYTIPLKFSYSHPEFDFSRPMQNVKVNYYGEESILYQYGGKGETQTLDNDFITTRDQAIKIAEWVCDSLRSRKQISGEFRGDPRFDIFDVVKVEGKYSTVVGVVLTEIVVSFTGAFKVTYSGYIHGSGEPVVYYSGEKYAGEV